MDDFICETEEKLHVMLAHEAHSVSHLIEDDEGQALVHFQRGYAFPIKGCFTVLEEAHDLIVVEISTRLMEGSW